MCGKCFKHETINRIKKPKLQKKHFFYFRKFSYLFIFLLMKIVIIIMSIYWLVVFMLRGHFKGNFGPPNAQI